MHTGFPRLRQFPRLSSLWMTLSVPRKPDVLRDLSAAFLTTRLGLFPGGRDHSELPFRLHYIHSTRGKIKINGATLYGARAATREDCLDVLLLRPWDVKSGQSNL